MKRIKVLVTIEASDETSDVDVQYGVGNVLEEDPAFQLNGWTVAMAALADDGQAEFTQEVAAMSTDAERLANSDSWAQGQEARQEDTDTLDRMIIRARAVVAVAQSR